MVQRETKIFAATKDVPTKSREEEFASDTVRRKASK